jgi:hypothetical protein
MRTASHVVDLMLLIGGSGLVLGTWALSCRLLEDDTSHNQYDPETKHVESISIHVEG